ncbi:hypothetical protein EVC62_14925 [Salinicola endophyticus]|uniref:Glycosyl transferase family 2 n=2 Tax=Salinicola endophyticus TaxID=1949083 RepID=A0ABY8FJ74_9GAMM|nr:hypothetical protein EVC62_14925 [Salinicola endophyticus]
MVEMMARRDPAVSYRHAMVAIVKNEREYLPEWVAYHRMIGFEHFYIADNGSDDGTDLLLASWQRLGLVTTCRWTPEDKAQTSWYAHVLETWGREAEFMAFLDADEFLVHPHCDRPLEWLAAVLAPADVGAVAINWRIFGSSHMQRRQPGGVLERFTQASHEAHAVNCHFKSIVRPQRVKAMTAHAATLEPGYRYVGAGGDPVAFLDDQPRSGRTREVIASPLKIYHYNIKSRQEFIDTKLSRGRANMPAGNTRDMQYFRNHDLNQETLGFSSELLARLREETRLLLPVVTPPPPPRFFVHIPKTAGTSFRLGARHQLGSEGVWHDYGEKQRETAPEVALWAHQRRDSWQLWQCLRERQVRLLAGHVGMDKYGHLAGLRDSFTFVREPLQRIASEYHHFVRHHQYRDSFQTFYRRQDMINRQARFLESTRLEALGMVGITERYADSLALINDRYGWQIPGLAENLGHASVSHVYPIDPADEAALRELNASDFSLYEQALALFETRLALWREGRPYAHGGVQQCQPDRVVGWAWWAVDDYPVEVEVRVNDERVGCCVASGLRPGFLRWGAPRAAQVGFHLPLKAAPGDRVECRVLLTGQSLGRCQIAVDERLSQALAP